MGGRGGSGGGGARGGGKAGGGGAGGAPTASSVQSHLLAATSEAAARDYLANIPKSTLKQIAKELDVPTGRGITATDALTKVFVTGRLTTASIRF